MKADYIIVNGVRLTVKEAGKRIKVIYDLAKEIAGEFYDMNRSDKFRINWPDQDEFAASEWKSFVESARILLTQMLTKQEVPTSDKDRIAQALIIETEIAQGMERDARLQIFKGSQQFFGDKYENKNILEKFGKAPNMRAYLRRSTVLH